MQIVAVIAENEKDFVRSILGEETALAKYGGILVNGFLYKQISHKEQLKGNSFSGVMITEKALQYERLKYLFFEVFNHIRF